MDKQVLIERIRKFLDQEIADGKMSRVDTCQGCGVKAKQILKGGYRTCYNCGSSFRN